MSYIDQDLFELRVSLGSNIARIFYYSASNDKFILLHAFIKKSQKTPLKELEFPEEESLTIKKGSKNDKFRKAKK